MLSRGDEPGLFCAAGFHATPGPCPGGDHARPPDHARELSEYLAAPSASRDAVSWATSGARSAAGASDGGSAMRTFAAPRRPPARLGAGAHRAPRRGVGGLRRLQGRSRPHLRAVRGGALRHLHHRVDGRAADLPLAGAERGARRDRRLVARQRRGGAAQRAVRLRARQGAAGCSRRRRRAGARDSGRWWCTARCAAASGYRRRHGVPAVAAATELSRDGCGGRW